MFAALSSRCEASRFFFEEILEQAIVFAYFQIALFTRLLIVSDFPIFRMHAMCSLQPKFMIFACASRFLRAKNDPIEEKNGIIILRKRLQSFVCFMPPLTLSHRRIGLSEEFFLRNPHKNGQN